MFSVFHPIIDVGCSGGRRWNKSRISVTDGADTDTDDGAFDDDDDIERNNESRIGIFAAAAELCLGRFKWSAQILGYFNPSLIS